MLSEKLSARVLAAAFAVLFFSGGLPARSQAHSGQDQQRRPRQGEVVPGTERILEPEYLALLKGRRVGVLAHAASQTRYGAHIVDLLARRKSELELKMIFAPEHGFRSVDDELLPDSRDPVTG